MKYIKEFNNTNEAFFNKKDILIYGGILLLGTLFRIYTNKDANYLINTMKSQESKPSLFIQNKVDSLKEYLMTEIDSSDFKYKKELKDSINKIPIYVADLSKVGSGSAGGAQVVFSSNDMEKNVIFIDNGVENSNIAKTILHEMYHFIAEYEKIDYTYIIDKKAIDDKNIFLNKVSIIHTGIPYNKLESKTQKTIVKNVSKLLYRKKDYYTSNSEVSARLLEMKNWLIAKGQINKISDRLNKEHLEYILENSDAINQDHFIDIFPFLNLNKLFNL